MASSTSRKVRIISLSNHPLQETNEHSNHICRNNSNLVRHIWITGEVYKMITVEEGYVIVKIMMGIAAGIIWVYMTYLACRGVVRKEKEREEYLKKHTPPFVK